MSGNFNRTLSIYDINTRSCLIKVNSNTIELTVDTSCFCFLDLFCVKTPEKKYFNLNLNSACQVYYLPLNIIGPAQKLKIPLLLTKLKTTD